MLERAILTLAICTLSLSQAFAGQTLSERIPADPTCTQFNDGCSVCRIEDGTATCSTPQTACLITGWACVQRTTPEGKPK
jgi:hypothetical protein